MHSVKVSVENLENSERILHEIDKNQPLEVIIKSVCEKFKKPQSTTVYGLKLITTNNGKIMQSYISESNINAIQNGYFLKLVYSVDYYVQRIFNHISDAYREQSFKDLYQLSIEPEFIKQLVKTQKHLVLINHFTISNLQDNELTACLIAIVHLFQRGEINEITSDFLRKVISVLKLESQAEQTKYALSIIHKILYHKEPTFKGWKEEIIKEIPLRDLFPYIWSEDNKDLQYGALLLINTIIKCCKDNKRQQLIKEINMRHNRDYIYTYIISPENIDKNMEHELYVYQTYLLSANSEALTTQIDTNNKDLFNRDEFELDCHVECRTSILNDEFDVDAWKQSSENVYDHNNRVSIASIASSIRSDATCCSSKTISTATNIDYNDIYICKLTCDALDYYKRNHHKNFNQFQVEEKMYGPGIYPNSEKITKMLAKILHIGIEPDRVSTCYQPTVFSSSSKTPFLLELFSLTMCLLSRTRKEMKAFTINDYEKVMTVMQKQIQIVLSEKPMNFKGLTVKMESITYQAVMTCWQNEKKQELNVAIETNPCIQELKRHYVVENKKLVYEQRMNCLKKGAVFPKITDKKINGDFFIKLSENMRQLIVNDWNKNKKTIVGEAIIYSISDITHIIQGRACPHVANNLMKDETLAFSIIINNAKYINFKAKDLKTSSYWTDALNLLLGKESRSRFYESELQDLVKMDLTLKLLELQNVSIPKKPPPIPPNPFTIRPPIPPKPQFLK